MVRGSFFFNSSLSVSLKKSQHRADELEAKLEAAEKALEEARAKATTAEEKLAGEKSKMATREVDIRLPLDTLNSSFTSKKKYYLVAILPISPSYLSSLSASSYPCSR
jgi:hypothetical protein